MEELQYLDEILLYLKTTFNSESSFNDMYKHISGNTWDSSVLPSVVDGTLDLSTGVIHLDDSKGTFYWQQRKFIIALRYLIDVEGLVFVPAPLVLSLTYKGLIKSRIGFVDAFEKELEDRRLSHDNLKASTLLSKKQKTWFNWSIGITIIGATAGLLSLLIQLWKKGESQNKESQTLHNRKIEKVHSFQTMDGSTYLAS
ncbi:hypothetical protein [Fluviicola sp.]|uniref:hypothetical protein n=1 Tax=Fluviicola sp. TaxID=1917219 RepID=UPI003D26BC60